MTVIIMPKHYEKFSARIFNVKKIAKTINTREITYKMRTTSKLKPDSQKVKSIYSPIQLF